jgi:hypothetical protein
MPESGPWSAQNNRPLCAGASKRICRSRVHELLAVRSE